MEIKRYKVILSEAVMFIKRSITAFLVYKMN